jgi:DNA-binding NarL/FixJ family response regulator
MVDMIPRVHAGRKCVPEEIAAGPSILAIQFLSRRELGVLHQVAAGRRNRDPALSLFIPEETVKVHLGHILDKRGAVDGTHLVTIAVQRGIIRR